MSDRSRGPDAALWRRVLVSVLFLPVFVLVVRRGGLAFLVLLEAIVVLGAHEAMALGRRIGARARPGIAYAAAILLPVAAARGGPFALLVIGAAATAVLLEAVVVPARRPASTSLAGTLLPLVYPALFASFIWLLRGEGAAATVPGQWPSLEANPLGSGAVLLLFAATWACDTAAYFGGRAFGRHPMAPSISPKKTWEGAVAGFAASCAVGAAAGPALVSPLSLPEGLLAGALLGVTGQLGDLAESLLKREAEVKDSSKTIPGHGGVLDRFDSVLVNAPVLFALLLVL